MGQGGDGCEGSAHARFELTPPRHFIYPAILLLLSEEPRHGYRLVDPLVRFGFGPFDRPSVYRALGDLEHDGLLSSWSAAPTAGTTRQVYALTPAGNQALENWMAVLAAYEDHLSILLKRYAALDVPGDEPTMTDIDGLAAPNGAVRPAPPRAR